MGRFFATAMWTLCLTRIRLMKKAEAIDELDYRIIMMSGCLGILGVLTL